MPAFTKSHKSASSANDKIGGERKTILKQYYYTVDFLRSEKAKNCAVVKMGRSRWQKIINPKFDT